MQVPLERTESSGSPVTVVVEEEGVKYVDLGEKMSPQEEKESNSLEEAENSQVPKSLNVWRAKAIERDDRNVSQSPPWDDMVPEGASWADMSESMTPVVKMDSEVAAAEAVNGWETEIREVQQTPGQVAPMEPAQDCYRINPWHQIPPALNQRRGYGNQGRRGGYGMQRMGGLRGGEKNGARGGRNERTGPSDYSRPPRKEQDLSSEDPEAYKNLEIKRRLHSVLNSFQMVGSNYNEWVMADNLQDPRFYDVRNYFDQLEGPTFYCADARQSIGNMQGPVSEECRGQFYRLKAVLTSLAEKIDYWLQASEA